MFFFYRNRIRTVSQTEEAKLEEAKLLLFYASPGNLPTVTQKIVNKGINK